MSLAGNKRQAASAEGEDDASRHVRPTANGEKKGSGSSHAFTVKRLTIPTEASPGQMLLESPLLLPGLLVRFRGADVSRAAGARIRVCFLHSLITTCLFLFPFTFVVFGLLTRVNLLYAWQR